MDQSVIQTWVIATADDNRLVNFLVMNQANCITHRIAEHIHPTVQWQSFITLTSGSVRPFLFSIVVSRDGVN
jgi:hypothetical protein